MIQFLLITHSLRCLQNSPGYTESVNHTQLPICHRYKANIPSSMCSISCGPVTPLCRCGCDCFLIVPLPAVSPYLTVLYCTVHCTVLHCTVLYCTVLYFTALYCTLLQCTTLHCTSLHWPYFTMSHRPPHLCNQHQSVKPSPTNIATACVSHWIQKIASTHTLGQGGGDRCTGSQFG